MWLSRYFVYFMLFSFMGWVYETIFCTIKGGKWANRGFLFGPVCPIYGAGAVGITALNEYFEVFTNITFTWWQIFIIAFFGSMILEYTTSWLLEKLFHAYWWDYSNVPLNIHGRICLPASLGFGGAGLLVVYIIDPFTRDITAWISPIGMELLALLFMALLAVDLTLTICGLTHFEHAISMMEDTWNRQMETFVDSIQEKKQNTENRIAEERARFSREHMEKVWQSSGLGERSTLRRVKGLRYPHIEKKKLEEVLLNVKQRVAKTKNTN